MNRLIKLAAWIKMQIMKDQHFPVDPPRKEGEPYWITKVHNQQEYDFRTGKRNDGRDL